MVERPRRAEYDSAHAGLNFPPSPGAVLMRLKRVVVLLALLCPPARGADVPKIGEAAGKLSFTDIRSLPRTLDDFGPKKATVLVFVNTSCPVVQRYLPTLQELESAYRSKEVQFVAVNSAEEDTLIAAATHAVKFGVEFPVVKDFDAACARALGVTRTPQAVVLDSEKKIRYRGRIDDQYRLRGNRKAPTTHDLKDALDAVLAGRPVAVSETEVDGCPITFPQPRKPRDVTFAGHVAPLLAKHCWECHRDGGSAPFALTTYKQASARAESIAEVVRDERMPPWFASHDFGPFVNRRGLTDDERAVIADWVRSGTAAGDLAKAPKPPEPVNEKWQIGTPDLVLRTKTFDLPARGDIPYQYAILLHHFAEDTWVQGVEIVSDNPRALHHANLAHVSLTGGFKEENFITGTVPGGEPMNLDRGVGFMIPKGSALALQIHFVPTGKPEKCTLEVGLRYPREVINTRLRHIQINDKRFAILPGAPAHKVSASRVLDTDVIGVGLFAHMHLRGKDMTFTAHAPDGKDETLLVIPNYNFSWQVPYRWEPGKKLIPKGTRLECVAHFDNSSFNPFNPDPKATVRNGQQTHEEMMYGFFFYTRAGEKLGLDVDPKTGQVRKPDGR
jgi:thiol-disulfide isomerase/thioredoxin